MTTEAEAAAAEARALEQARLRKERREAKIKAGATSRLNRITGLGGGLQRDVPLAPAATPSPASSSPAATPAPQQTQQPPKPPSQPQQHGDPEEVDISQHFYQPQTTPRMPPPPYGVTPPPANMADPMMMSEAQLRQMMLGFDNNGPGAGPAGGGPGAEDPMMRAMMQMMGGMGGMGGPGMGGGDMGGGMPGMPGLPGMGGMGGGNGGNPLGDMMNLMGGMGGGGMPGMGSFPGMMPGAPGQQQQAVLPDRYASLWRLLHTAVALGLGLYIALWTTFSGTKTERDTQSTLDKAFQHDDDTISTRRTQFFYAFATAEAVLLTSRFFMDRGRRNATNGGMMGGGLLGMAMGFLPPPIKSYVEIAMRYGQIFSTVKADVLVCIFVLGVCSWARS